SILYEEVFKYSSHTNLNWGIALHYTFILYSLLIATINMLLTFFGLRKMTIIILTILLLAYDIWLFQYFQYRPYKMIFLFTLSNTLLGLSFVVEKYLSK